jgi:glycosyltransferase involved in cell wall biosynthesis
MNCLICQKHLDGYTPLCSEHAPAWGQSLHIDDTTIIPGGLGVFDALLIKLMGRRLVRWWLGTDVWLLWAFPKGRGRLSVIKHRLKYHLTKFLVTENWVTSEILEEELIACHVRRTKVRYHIRGMLTEKIKKIPHDLVNIAYYYPKNSGDFQRYVYGIDLIEKLELMFPYPIVNWIPLDGKFTMREVYSIVDAVVRPSRHDGRPRILEECKLNSIPYYWSESGTPDLDSMSEFVTKVIDGKNRILQ